MNTHKKSLRGATPALTSVASAAALLLLSGGAQAATFSIGLPFGQPLAIAQIVADGYNTNMTWVQAQVLNNGVNSSQVGAGINTTVGNTGNTIGALAAGNRSAQSISTLAAAPNVPGQGAVAYAVAQNQGSITSLAGSNTISNTMGSLTGSSTVAGNQIYADTTVNEDRNTIAGQLPNGFNVSGMGSVNVSGLPASPSVTAEGGLVAVSTQNSLEQTSSGASATSNRVELILDQSIGNSLTGTATLDKNQVSATFRGNDADNSVSVAAGGAPSYVGSAVAGNVQMRNGANSYADAIGNNLVARVGVLSNGSVRGSLSVQGNAVGSEASGNSADNSVALADSLSVNTLGFVSSAGTAQTLGGLVVASNQSNTGNAALRSDTRTTLIAAQAGELTDSTVVAAGNAVSSQALGNTVTNGISNVGSTNGVSSSTLIGSAVIGNVQVNQIGLAAPGVNGDVWARTEGTQIQAAAASGTGLGRNAISASSNTISAQAAASSASNTVDLQGATLWMDGGNAGVTVAPAAPSVAVGAGVLNSQRNVTTDVTSENNGASIAVFNGGATLNSTLQANSNALTSVASGNGSDNSVRLHGVNVDATTAVVNQQTNDTSRILATLGTAGAPYAVSVSAASGSASASQLSVDGNSGLASATANAATNRLTVAGTTLAGNSPGASSNGTVTADHVLSNDQQVARTLGIASGQRAYANGVLSAQGGLTGLSASNSSLSLADNVQDARALGNTATNTLSLTGTALDSRSALASSQASSASVTADSLLTLSAGANSSTQSSVTLDANRNTVLATTNRAFNTLQVQGTNVGSVSSGPASISASITPLTTADHVLTNQQFGGGEQASSFASTSLNNVTQGAIANRSTLAATDNVTWAESVVNYAANTLDVAGTANLRGAAALYNNQTNTTGAFNGGAGVTASSQTNVGGLNRYTFGLNSATDSSVALNDNTTVALAYGNSAANALNAVAGGTYNGLTVATNTAVTPYSVVGAQYALLNNQGNLSNVTASSSAIYDVGAANLMTATNSALNAAGNSVAALAYGNSATNALQLAALNSGMPTAAVSSAQTNTGAITATASSSSVAIAGAGALGSSLAVRGNQITATAVGNSSTSTIQAAR